jgi:hypothetical protein
MPAWMAGIQVCRMRPETSMSAWIPALHAGMTETRSRTKTDRGPPPFLFSKEFRKHTKGSDIFDYEFRVAFGLAQGMLCVVKSVAHRQTSPRPDPRSSILDPRFLWLRLLT